MGDNCQQVLFHLFYFIVTSYIVKDLSSTNQLILAISYFKKLDTHISLLRDKLSGPVVIAMHLKFYCLQAFGLVYAVQRFPVGAWIHHHGLQFFWQMVFIKGV